MNVTPEELTFGASLLGLLGVGFKWVRLRIDRIERERAAAEDRLRETATMAASECRKDNATLLDRLRTFEDRSHAENRQDRDRLCTVLELNARAFQRLADRLPDATPANGHRTQG